MRPKLARDPRNLIPIIEPRVLGLGVDTKAQLERLFRENLPAPAILKVAGRLCVLEGDLTEFRERVIARALREAHQGDGHDGTP